ncbi:PH domain-containing protein [Psychromicrobium sp. YIM B11713]|uniref:PH domain-containing protein n=1 Tax=Psychromicrobium sp. YIM B11713 TaxID=3145233 RepID=UPI00374FAC55
MPIEHFRPRSAKIMAIVLYVIAVAGLLLAFLSGFAARDLVLSLPVLALVAYSGYWLFWFPVVTVTDQGILVVNPVRTASVPWLALRSLGTKYSLTLVTDSGKYSAWAAPAPGAASRKDPETPAVLAVRARWKAFGETASSASSNRASTPVLGTSAHQDSPHHGFKADKVSTEVNWLQTGIALGLVLAIVLCALFVR